MIKDICTRLKCDYHEWKKTFLICFVINLLFLATCIIHVTYSGDDYSAIFKKSTTIVSGRWVIDFVHNVLCRTNLMPTLTPVLCIAVYILSGIGLCQLWGIQNKKLCIIAIALWTIHPYVLEIYNFKFSSLSISLGHLWAVLALCITNKNKWGFIFSVVLWYLALSTYQSILGFGVSLIMIQLLLMAVREHFSREVIQICLRYIKSYLWMFCVSIFLYGVLTKAIFVLYHVEVNPRITAGIVHNMDQFVEKAGWLAIMFSVRLLPIQEYIMPLWVKSAIFLVFIAGIISLWIKSPNKLIFWGAFVWLLLIPLGSIFPIPPLVLSASTMPWRVCTGLSLLLPGMFILTQVADLSWIRKISFGSALFILANFILIGNMIFYERFRSNQKDEVMGNRLIAKIQSLENYRPGMELAIIGRYEKKQFSRAGKNYWEIVREYAKHGSKTQYSLGESAFETDWAKYSFLINYLDLELMPCSPEREKTARLYAAGHNPWPDPSSVFIQDRIVIVVLSSP